MLKSRHVCVVLATTVIAVLLFCATSLASITVNLRVEGSTKTLFEGPVTTQPERFATESTKGTSYPCNYKENGPSSEENKTFEDGGNEGATPTTALRDAAIQSGLAFNAKWFGSGKSGTENPGDFFVTQVGLDIEKGSEAWGYAVDDTTAVVGGCQIALAPGNEVLWAYNYFNLKHLLVLSGSTNANTGTSFVVHVTDGQTGTPIAGATIGEDIGGVTTALAGDPTTNASGAATVSLTHTGVIKLKATRPESVRSNGIEICVHNGNDGTCGTVGPSSKEPVIPTPAPPVPANVARVGGVKNGHHYRHGKGPRILTGVVRVPAGGTLRDVRISLQRRSGRRCQVFSGTRAAFVRARCGVARFFSVGSAESFSYLLPSALPAGRYVYQVEAIDDAGQRTKPIAGVSHVVFYVK